MPKYTCSINPPAEAGVYVILTQGEERLALYLDGVWYVANGSGEYTAAVSPGCVYGWRNIPLEVK